MSSTNYLLIQSFSHLKLRHLTTADHSIVAINKLKTFHSVGLNDIQLPALGVPTFSHDPLKC